MRTSSRPSIVGTIRKMHPLLKGVTLCVVLAPWGVLNFWTSFQTIISLDCPGCWERSCIAFFGFPFLFAVVCIVLFLRWRQKLGAFFGGLSLFWALMIVLESDMVLVGLFLNADPFLLKQKRVLSPEWQPSDMDTTRIFGIPPDAYVPNIKRWDMYRRIKNQNQQIERSKP